MRIKYLSIVITFAAVIFASCKKDGVNANNSTKSATVINPTLSQIAGKWQISKVTTYSVDSLGNKSNTTVYQQSLSDQNYIQFNQDSTCVWSADHYYVFEASEKFVVPQSSFRISQYGYLVKGSAINLSRAYTGPMPPMGPQSFYEDDSATLPTANSLVIHSVYANYNKNTQVVSDTYYTR